MAELQGGGNSASLPPQKFPLGVHSTYGILGVETQCVGDVFTQCASTSSPK